MLLIYGVLQGPISREDIPPEELEANLADTAQYLLLVKCLNKDGKITHESVWFEDLKMARRCIEYFDWNIEPLVLAMPEDRKSSDLHTIH